MAASILTDAYPLKFKDLDLSGALVSWNDKIGIRLATHRYLKRDGAENEPMGADPGEFRMRLVFVGPDWAKRYRELVTSIRQEPRGLMVHPLLGKVRVACQTSVGDVDPPRQRDTIQITLSFIEDAIDTALVVDDQEGPAAKQQKVTDNNNALTTAAAKYPTA